ncbi:MAG: ATP-binding protein [Crocinitomicaceae bacterium]|nr:ATP-binding protein [Crocinitomicaceae bacterium]
MSELKRMISEGEGVSLGFEYRIEQKKIARTITAFANTKGGKILVGVQNNGKVKGVDPQEELYNIEKAVELYCKPPVEFVTTITQENHHLVLEVNIEPSKSKHKAKDEAGNWKYYHRVNNQTLLENKVLFRLWHYQIVKTRKPDNYTEEVTQLIKLIDIGQPITISKIYRLSDFDKNEVNDLLARLIFWGVIEMQATDSGLEYVIAE